MKHREHSPHEAPKHTLLAWVYGADRRAGYWLWSTPNAHTVMLVLHERGMLGHVWWRTLAESYGADAVERVPQRKAVTS